MSIDALPGSPAVAREAASRNPADAAQPLARGRFQGAVQILRYNAPFFAATLVGAALVSVAPAFVPVPPLLALAARAGAAVALLWSLSALVVSHHVYDRSGLYDLRWIATFLPGPVGAWSSIHAGLDESTPLLLTLFPRGFGGVYDVYDEREMPEPSIRKARRITPPQVAPEAADFRKLPIVTASRDTVFLLFAAHELRRATARDAFFAELARVLRPGGRVLIVEHLRDLPNLLAFGPGAFHFMPRGEWLRLARGAALDVERERSFTPFVRVFLLRKREGE